MAQLEPTKRAQLAHVVNLISLAMVDGSISKEEKSVLYNVSEALGLTDEEFEFCVKTAEESNGKVIIEVPESDDEKTFYLKNLTLMMMSDGQLEDSEKEYIKFIAEKFGYDGDKALEILINSVYQEIKKRLDSTAQETGSTVQETGSTVQETKSNKGGMSDEEFKKETQRLKVLGKEALTRHEIGKAFDYLLIPAHLDAEAQNLFLMVINTYNRLYLLNEKQIAQLKDYAEKGYALSQYAYARYLDAVRPEDDSLKQANDYYKAAEKAGIADALYSQSYLMKVGYYGMVDREESNRLLMEAGNKGSTLATRNLYYRYIYGKDGVEQNPKIAIDTILKWLDGDESNDISVVNPMYYSLLGDAYFQLEDYENAKKYYWKAINMGYVEAYGDYCYACNMIDDVDYVELLDKGIDAGDPNSCLYKAAYLMDNYEDLGNVTGDIMHYLITSIEMGNTVAPYFLGDAIYYEKYGCKKDNALAWNYFVQGSKRDDGEAYKMLATMIANEDNPYEVSEGLAYYCVMMALRNGCKDMLKIVVESYRNGEFTDYAAEIERYYIPEYDNLLPEEEDDKEEDNDDEEEEEDDYDYQLIAIVKTDGTADIIEFDVEEGWDELPEFVGANRLDAIRTQPLYDISEQIGYTSDHITAWVDNMGLMKDLPMNPIGCKLYPGPIAGDMILTLEDSKYNPKSFDNIDDLKKIIAALGAKLENICLDDGPDDDGRYDAWS